MNDGSGSSRTDLDDSEGIAALHARLPLEILPHILGHLQWRTRDLAACSLVCTTWHRFATPLLYARLFLRTQQRLIRVFAALEANERLARLVRVLEIRVFPFGLRAEQLEKLEASILRSLQAAVRLEELHWTRTGSLTDRVIPFLPVLPNLHTLELTGSSRFYSPGNIARHLLSPDKTPCLQHFSIVLPDRDVVADLPNWARVMGAKLTSFSILCQHSAFVTDDTLRAMSQHLTGLTRLSVAGCKAATADGILALLRGTSARIRDLAIEGLAIHPASFPILSRYLTDLRSLSLTFPRQSLCPVADFWQNLSLLVEDLPNLEKFTHYTSSWNTPRATYAETLDSDDEASDDDAGDAGRRQGQDASRFDGSTSQEYRRYEMEEHAQSGRPIVREPKLSSSFLRRLIASRGKQLVKLRIHGIVTSMEQVAEIARGCANLQDLVLHLYEGDSATLQNSLAKLARLRSLHIISSLYSDVYLSEHDLRTIAAHCSTDLRQIGFRNRVWLVERMPLSALTSTQSKSNQADSGQEQVSVPMDDGRRLMLRRWDMSAGTFPEVLLVVRACEWTEVGETVHCRTSFGRVTVFDC